MANSDMSVNASDLARAITLNITVRGMRWWNFRLTAGLAVMRLGVWITGTRCNVTAEETQK